MQDYQQRVVDEKSALDEKIKKLNEFIFTPKCLSLHEVDQEILCAQLFHMKKYGDILHLRISRF